MLVWQPVKQGEAARTGTYVRRMATVADGKAREATQRRHPVTYANDDGEGDGLYLSA